METNVNQRLNDIVNYLIYSKVALDKTDLSKKLGYNASSFSQIINERVPLTDRFINRLMEFAPNIDKNWLLTGEGTMLKTEATMTPYPIEGAAPQGGRYIVRNHKKATPAHIGNTGNSLRAQGAIELQGVATAGTAAPISIIGGSGALLDPSAPAGVTGTLPKAQPSATPTEAMRDGVNVITDAEVLDLSNYPVEVIEELRTEIKKDEAVPIISAEVAACDKYDISEYLEEDNELEHFIPSDMTADVDGAEIVRKTSMLPTFAPNDVVFIKLIKDKKRITDGGTYYFKLRKRATMIRMAKIKGNELRLIAQNPQYGDVITTFDEVINVASIEGLYRKNIANQYNEIEALRRQKDAQTDELIKQNGDALKIVDRLVSVIEKKQ